MIVAVDGWRQRRLIIIVMCLMLVYLDGGLCPRTAPSGGGATTAILPLSKLHHAPVQP